MASKQIQFPKRFISGLGHVGTFMTTFSLSLEYVGASHRTLFGILIETPFALGGLVVGLVSWAGVRRWQTLSLVLSAPNLLILSYWWLLPESPRWLIGRMQSYPEIFFISEPCPNAGFQTLFCSKRENWRGEEGAPEGSRDQQEKTS